VLNVTAAKSRIQWDGSVPVGAVEALAAPGGLVVCATKVGYILMATDGEGLDRKFDAKQRNRNKPGVVLCSSLGQLQELAQTNAEILSFYRTHWDEEVLLGCVLPWREEALRLLPDDTAKELTMDRRGTSCFVIKFGKPAEQIVGKLWEERKLTFASSANPSGSGNKGRVEGIGRRIETSADLVVAADEYVAAVQSDKTEESRHEQGVMISMVDAAGNLVPEQRGERGIVPCPTLIRRGLACERIMENLAIAFPSWDYRQGMYY
jgi:tRNA A37 threonylcarbamoyladenosine synthetase subunit TsaC/SUA5/YrdC